MRTYDADTRITISVSTATVAKVVVGVTITTFLAAVSAKVLADSLELQLKKRKDNWEEATNGEEEKEGEKGKKQK